MDGKIISEEAEQQLPPQMDRPYPEFYNNDPNKAILRDFPNYYADATEGRIYSIKSGKAIKHHKKGSIGLYVDGKQRVVIAQCQLLTAFRPWPGHGYTVDHIDPRRPDDHRLSNLRWADKKQQRANQVRPSEHVGKKRAIVVTDEDKTYASAADWLKALRKDTSNGNITKVRTAILNGRRVLGCEVKWWVPPNTGDFALIPSDVIGGEEGYYASQFGGWIKLRHGQYTQGWRRYDGRCTVGIGGKLYYSYRLVGVVHLTPSTDPSKTEINHIDGNPANNDYTNLEWVTQRENVQHAHDTGLSSSRKPVVQFSLVGEKLRTFSYVGKAVTHLQNTNKRASSTGISHCCSKRYKHAYGFKWSFAEDDTNASDGEPDTSNGETDAAA